MDGLTFAFTLGIVIMLILIWWTTYTRSGRRWNGTEDENDKK